jgi:hypothetical protein
MMTSTTLDRVGQPRFAGTGSPAGSRVELRVEAVRLHTLDECRRSGENQYRTNRQIYPGHPDFFMHLSEERGEGRRRAA